MPSPRPHFDRLYQLASGQHGYFTTRQAAEVGYSPQALQKHLHAGRLRRVLHGLYRVAQFPAAGLGETGADRRLLMSLP